MPFQIVRSDIESMKVDAIVSAADPSLPGGGAVGQARIAEARGLPCRYVIRTVGPRWRGGLLGERRRLRSCYRSALELAKEHGCESVAFPLISADEGGFGADRALRAAEEAVGEFLAENDMTVFLVLSGRDRPELSPKLSRDIEAYIDGHYVERRPARSDSLPGSAIHYAFRPARPERDEYTAPAHSAPISYDAAAGVLPPVCAPEPEPDEAAPAPSAPAPTAPKPQAPAPAAPKPKKAAHTLYSLGTPATPRETTAAIDELFDELDESFQQMLLRKIDESGMTDAQCYKKANVDRKLFSKIRKDEHYKPSKSTALAFAVALELSLWETESLLNKAGFALSRSSKFDVIIRYFIEHRIYNIFLINEVLFHYDQSLLGAL